MNKSKNIVKKPYVKPTILLVNQKAEQNISRVLGLSEQKAKNVVNLLSKNIKEINKKIMPGELGELHYAKGDSANVSKRFKLYLKELAESNNKNTIKRIIQLTNPKLYVNQNALKQYDSIFFKKINLKGKENTKLKNTFNALSVILKESSLVNTIKVNTIIEKFCDIKKKMVESTIDTRKIDSTFLERIDSLITLTSNKNLKKLNSWINKSISQIQKYNKDLNKPGAFRVAGNELTN